MDKKAHFSSNNTDKTVIKTLHIFLCKNPHFHAQFLNMLRIFGYLKDFFLGNDATQADCKYLDTNDDEPSWTDMQVHYFEKYLD